MQRESGARVIRFVPSLFRRFATGLAVMAALALVLEGAVGSDHHLGATPASGGYYHAHAHSHGPADASDHQLIDSEVADGVDLAAADRDSASGPDASACCCFCASCAAIVLPCVSAQVVPFVVLRTMPSVHRRHADGIVPDGLQRPPRPLVIA